MCIACTSSKRRLRLSHMVSLLLLRACQCVWCWGRMLSVFVWAEVYMSADECPQELHRSNVYQSLHARYVVEHLALLFDRDALIFHMPHVQIEYAPHFLVHEPFQFEQQVLA